MTKPYAARAWRDYRDVPAFWREVERRHPEWRLRRDYLTAHGAGIKAEAKRLFG